MWKSGGMPIQVSFGVAVGEEKWRRLDKEHNLNQLILCIGVVLERVMI